MLNRLRVRDFRNYVSAELLLDSSLTVLAGRNAQGKTAILEAVHLLGTGQILRGHRDSEAIRDAQPSFRVEGLLSRPDSEIAVELVRGGRKKALLNGLPLPRASDLLGRLPCVVFTSADLSIVQGEPSERRLFLDTLLCQVFAGYLRHLASYKRAVEQRNALLRRAQDAWVSNEQFESWEAELAEHGAAIRRVRSGAIESLDRSAKEAHSELAIGETLEVRSEPCDDAIDASSLLTLLSERRKNDIARGTTSVGPHRDDVGTMVDGKSARLYGSQGQQRTAALSLKLASLRFATRELGVPPMLLLDDVFAELDKFRQSKLLESAFHEEGQVLMTCTEIEQVGTEALARAKVVKVHAGELSE